MALRKAKFRTDKDKIEIPVLESIVLRGWPMPIRDYKFARDELGRMWSVDFAWPDAKLPALYGLRLAFSIEGGGERGRHLKAAGYAEDLEKHNAALLLGWAVFRFTGAQIAASEHIRILRLLWPLE